MVFTHSMKKILKFILCFIVAASIITIFIMFAIAFLSPSDTKYTEDINDYNTEDFPLHSYRVFPEKIPQNAEVVSFSNYKYYVEDTDVYLELKFSSIEHFEEYLSMIKLQASEQNEWETVFITEQNPYDSSYTDLFFAYFCMYEVKDIGYSVKLSYGDVFYISTDYWVISYSVENLTVIHSYSHGSFVLYEHVPQYLKRFNIPLDEENERIHAIESPIKDEHE